MNREPDDAEHEGRRSKGAAGSTTTCRGKVERKCAQRQRAEGNTRNKAQAVTPTKETADSKNSEKRRVGNAKAKHTMTLDLRTLTENVVVAVDRLLGTKSIPDRRSADSLEKRGRGRPRKTVVTRCGREQQNKRKQAADLKEASGGRPVASCGRGS